MLPLMPHEIVGEIASFLTAEETQALHSVSKDVCMDTTGIVKLEPRTKHHYVMGDRIHKLESDCIGLYEAFRRFKCSGTRVNNSRDREVFDRCIKLNGSWSWGHVFVELRGVMDSVSSVEKVPIGIPGTPDLYYQRNSKHDPVAISDGPTFTSGDLTVVMGYLKNLQSVTLDVLIEATKIAHRHEIYAKYPGALKRILTLLEKRISWLEAKMQE